MKAEELKKITDDITSIGYEIMEIKAECFSYSDEARKIVTGAYALRIAPIKKN